MKRHQDLDRECQWSVVLLQEYEVDKYWDENDIADCFNRLEWMKRTGEKSWLLNGKREKEPLRITKLIKIFLVDEPVTSTKTPQNAHKDHMKFYKMIMKNTASV